ncbi:MAG: hypothetical protein AAGD86_12365, partial [Pseudomonadota bacterium]
AIGHTMDADGRMLALGSYLRDRRGNEWQFRVRRFELNRAGELLPHTVSVGPRDLLNVELSHSRMLGGSRVELLVGADNVDDVLTGTSETTVRASAEFRYEF